MWLTVRLLSSHPPSPRRPHTFFFARSHSSSDHCLVWFAAAGSLAGNHFLTLTSGLDNLAALGQLVQWDGAQDIKFELL